MTTRCAVLLAPRELTSTAAPRGIPAADLAGAMISDVAEVLHDLSGVDSLVACSPAQQNAVRQLVWADVPILSTRPGSDVEAAVQQAAERGYTEVVVVAADVPDLPQMVLAKIFQALATFPVAIAPADNGGGAVAVGVTLPAPEWVATWLGQAVLDAPSVVDGLRAVAPRAGQVRMTPAWHRLRTPDDLRRLDHGLEGWEATRALVGDSRDV